MLGGTCMGVVRKWKSRVNVKGKDPNGMESWIYKGIEGQSAQVLFTAACRACNQQVRESNSKTEFMQQWTMLRHVGDKNHKWGEKFIADLIKFIQD